jgi:hypothetical protein
MRNDHYEHLKNLNGNEFNTLDNKNKTCRKWSRDQNIKSVCHNYLFARVLSSTQWIVTSTLKKDYLGIEKTWNDKNDNWEIRTEDASNETIS